MLGSRDPNHSPVSYPDSSLRDIEAWRADILNDHRKIEVLDLGVGSKHARSPHRLISEIARHSLSDRKYAAIYARTIAHYNALHVLELGTSLGINALYLAAHYNTHVITLEGSPAIGAVAADLFADMKADNISLIMGNIDDNLQPTVAEMPRIDFAFLDANHRHAPTLRYFDMLRPKLHAKSIVVLDDIHSSPEMQQAWRDIQKHPDVTASADLFRCGFVFFDPSLGRQHFVLQT